MSNFSAEIQARLNLTEVNKALQSLAQTKIVLSNVTIDTGKISTQMQQAGTKAGNSFSSSFSSTANRAITAINTGSLEASIAKVTAQYEKLGTTGSSKLAGIKDNIQQLVSLQSTMKATDPADVLAQNYTEFNTILAKVKNNLATVSAESKAAASTLQINTLDNKIATWLEKNSKASKDFGANIDSLRSRLASLNASGTATVSELNAIEQEFNEVKQAAITAGQVGTSVGSQLKGAFASITRYVSVSTVIYQSISALKEMYQNVYDIDTEMTELKKVTNETSEAYSNFLSNAGSTAKEIGTTITDLVSSTADFARLGYSFEDAQSLAEVANIYAVVGDEIDSIDTATESIISTLTAFHIEAEDAMSIVDKFNEVGKKNCPNT